MASERLRKVVPMIRPLLLTAAFSALAMTPACADATKTASGMNEAELESFIHEYIVTHPEVIEEAIIALNARDKAEAAAAMKAAITANAAALYNTSTDHFIGPADAPVTIVEFFDYRCGYCKRSVDYVQGLPNKYNGKVRVVFKEYPIFGGISETAALAALAAGNQGKYNEMHIALMGLKSNDDLTEKKIDELAAQIGVNVKKMRADMKSVTLQKQLNDMQVLGHALDLGGTPGFYIGDEHVEGANLSRIEALISAELES